MGVVSRPGHAQCESCCSNNWEGISTPTGNFHRLGYYRDLRLRCIYIHSCASADSLSSASHIHRPVSALVLLEALLLPPASLGFLLRLVLLMHVLYAMLIVLLKEKRTEADERASKLLLYRAYLQKEGLPPASAARVVLQAPRQIRAHAQGTPPVQMQRVKTRGL